MNKGLLREMPKYNPLRQLVAFIKKKVISRFSFSCVRDTSSQVGCVSRRIVETTTLNSVTSFLYVPKKIEGHVEDWHRCDKFQNGIMESFLLFQGGLSKMYRI